MPISSQDVLHVAKLAKLQLAPEEVEHLRGDLEKILEYVALLDEVNTTSVAPTAHVTVTHSPLREDEIHPRLTTEQALAEAPRRSADGFAVPSFVDEG